MHTTIMSFFNQIIAYLNGEDLRAMLSQDLQSYMYGAYSLVMRLQQHAVGPIALSILAIFALLELQKISMKVEGISGVPMPRFEMITKTLIKFVLCYIVVLRIQDILDGIIIITSSLTARVIEVGNDGVLNNVADRANLTVADLPWWEQLVILLAMCIMFLVPLVVRVLIQVAIYLRFLELYIFCAMAPIPMGALPNQEFPAMPKSFFKNLAATGLQATLIGLVLVIYPFLFIKIMEEVSSGIWEIIMGLTIYMLALLPSINKTRGWAKTLLSAS